MLSSHWNSGGQSMARAGQAPTVPGLFDGLTGATIDEVKEWAPRDRWDGQPVLIDGRWWVWDLDATVAGDDQLVIEPTNSDGRVLRMPGTCVLEFAFTKDTADAATLYTVPTGAVFLPIEFGWHVTTGFTGGSSSAIGVSSTKSGFTTKGDLLGGATGDVAATLVAGDYILGTIGPKWDSVAERRAIWRAGDTFRFDRITSAFTAGAGSVWVLGHLLANAGA